MERAPASRQFSAVAALYRSTKTYDHSEGLSCCFRQWRANHSHCRLLHGYALAFKFTFACSELDERNWCLDFGSLKPIKSWLHEMFDHTLVVAHDDPALPRFEELAVQGLVELRVLPAVGCEATASFVFEHVSRFVAEQTHNRVWLETVEVKEHGGNSAIFAPTYTPTVRSNGSDPDVARVFDSTRRHPTAAHGGGSHGFFQQSNLPGIVKK